MVLQTGASSDGRWVAFAQGYQLKLRPADGGEARVVEPDYIGSYVLRFVWSPASTLLYYRPSANLWMELTPATGEAKPYHPEYLKGRSAGDLAFSQDGTRLLYTTNLCYECNHPVRYTETHYVLDLRSGTHTEVGVDRPVRWEGNSLVVDRPDAPQMGYYPYWARQAQGPLELKPPVSLWGQLRATPYAEWRVYPPGGPEGGQPLAVYPVTGVSTNAGEIPSPQPYFSTAILPDLPDQPTVLQLWAEVYPGAEPDPSGAFRTEGGRTWTVAFSAEVKPNLQPSSAERALLSRIAMEDKQSGWGVGTNGAILRTADGGNTWRDTTPPGLAALFGQAQVRRVEELRPGGIATVAAAHWTLTSENHWTDSIARVTVFHTTDGGATWSSGVVETGIPFAAPASISFVDKLNGFVSVIPADTTLPETGALFATHDGGQSWTPVGQTPAPGKVQFITPQRGWLASLRGAQLFQTEDGGRTWSRQATHNSILDPVFLNAQDAYSWNYEGRRLEWTRDGGQTWSSIPWQDSPTDVGQFDFVDRQVGWLIRNDIPGQLRRTEDGGQTWTVVEAHIVR